MLAEKLKHAPKLGFIITLDNFHFGLELTLNHEKIGSKKFIDFCFSSQEIYTNSSRKIINNS